MSMAGSIFVPWNQTLDDKNTSMSDYYLLFLFLYLIYLLLRSPYFFCENSKHHLAFQQFRQLIHCWIGKLDFDIVRELLVKNFLEKEKISKVVSDEFHFAQYFRRFPIWDLSLIEVVLFFSFFVFRMFSPVWL